MKMSMVPTKFKFFRSTGLDGILFHIVVVYF